MSDTWTIPEVYADIRMECGDCPGKKPLRETPVVMLIHLRHAHGYTEAAARKVIDQWIDSYEQDENGSPYDRCNSHGLYPAGDPCPGCDAEDASLKRAMGEV